MSKHSQFHMASIAVAATLFAAASTALATTPNPDGPPQGDPMLPPTLPQFPDAWDPFDPSDLPQFSGEVLDFPFGDFGDLPLLPCRLDVPSEYPTIQAAVDAAENDCLIVVAEGTYHENVEIHAKAVRIVGDGDVHLWPDTDGPILAVTNTPEGHVVQFDGLMFSSVTRVESDFGRTLVFRMEDGVAIAAGLASVRVTNCEFTDLSTGMLTGEGDFQCGAGIYGVAANIEVERCDFSLCEAPEGGALAASGCDVSLDQSRFEQCAAIAARGGVLLAHTGQVRMSQCSFGNNSASLGGHCYFSSLELEASRCLFEDGSAASGGAVASAGLLTAAVSSCHFRANTAGESADAWYHDATDAQGPYMAANAFCGGHSMHGMTEGIVPIVGDETCDACDGDTGMDGSVSVVDLIDVLEVWGTRDPLADLDGSDNVDLTDLMAVIDGFGGCNDWALPDDFVWEPWNPWDP